SIQVSVYEDRVEVMSPGMLYGGMDLETAMKGKSKCRNAALAEAFYYMGIVEAWGTRIPRIINKCKEYGLPSPTFEELGDGFKVTMFRKVSNATCVNKDLIQEGIDVFDKYIVLLKQNNISLKCISNIEVIFRKFNKDTIFGQSDVMQLLECSKSKATNLMGAMKDADLIEVVRGLGAGKYKFKNH
ncbi:MAG: ATP-binding protein, partial [Eubacteriales bacterium]